MYSMQGASRANSVSEGAPSLMETQLAAKPADLCSGTSAIAPRTAERARVGMGTVVLFQQPCVRRLARKTGWCGFSTVVEWMLLRLGGSVLYLCLLLCFCLFIKVFLTILCVLMYILWLILMWFLCFILVDIRIAVHSTLCLWFWIIISGMDWASSGVWIK